MPVTFSKVFPIRSIFSFGNKKKKNDAVLGGLVNMGVPALTQSCASAKIAVQIIVWFGFLYIYGTSTITGYLMPNPLLYI